MARESSKARISSFTGTGLVRVIDDADGAALSRNMTAADLAAEVGAALGGAAAIDVADVADNFTATDVEGVLAELAAAVAGAGGSPDAADVSVADVADNFTATDVEGVLAELADEIAGLGGSSAITPADTDASGFAFVVDEDDMASNSATKIPTQQSVRAYVQGVAFGDATVTVGIGGAVVVASTDAPAPVKAAADFVCDGTADQVQINDAITLAAAGPGRDGPSGGEQRGRVVLTGGRFNINGSILMRTGVTLMGQGALTEIRAVSLSAITGNGSAAAMIKLLNANVHLCRVSSIFLNGNFSAGVSGSVPCHGIYFDGTGGGDQTGYPNSDPDSCNILDNMFITGFTTLTRHAIWIRDTQMRGTQIADMWEIRNVSGNAIFIDNAPDGQMNNIHIGTVTGTGILITGGNWRVWGCKAFYCDSWGMQFNNARMAGAAIEAQDCYNGIRFGGADVNVEGITVDNSDVIGLEIAANRVICSFSVLHRGGGRYPNTNVGVQFTGTPTGCNVQGVVNTSSITTPIAGTRTGAANFVRISHGSTLESVG